MILFLEPPKSVLDSKEDCICQQKQSCKDSKTGECQARLGRLAPPRTAGRNTRDPGPRLGRLHRPAPRHQVEQCPHPRHQAILQ